MKYIACFAAILLPLTAFAQDAVPDLRHAIIVARGGTITITRLPIKTPAGTIYRDVTIELHADATGHITLVTATPAPTAGNQVALASRPSGAPAPAAVELPQRASPPIVMQTFTPGTYSGRDGSLIELQDRGMDLVHHVPSWSISAAGNDGAIASITFYSGPPFMNPRAKRLARAQITADNFAYGTSDAGSSGAFQSGALIGVAQNDKTLRVVSYRHGCCTDSEEPVAELDYTYLGR